MKYTKDVMRRICIIANQLKKMGLTLSAAFKKAWSLIRCQYITTKVKGVTFGNGQRVLERNIHSAPFLF